MNWQAGEPVAPRVPLTIAATNCRLLLDSRGFLTFVDRQSISFYMGRAGGGYIEAQCPIDVFALNFQKRIGAGINRAYIRTKHELKVFPKDYLV